MKTLSKFGMTALTAIAGIAGAFVTTSAASSDSLALVQGFRPLGAEPCHAEIMCETVETDAICTVSGFQLWGKTSPNATTCAVRLYRSNN